MAAISDREVKKYYKFEHVRLFDLQSSEGYLGTWKRTVGVAFFHFQSALTMASFRLAAQALGSYPRPALALILIYKKKMQLGSKMKASS